MCAQYAQLLSERGHMPLPSRQTSPRSNVGLSYNGGAGSSCCCCSASCAEQPNALNSQLPEQGVATVARSAAADTTAAALHAAYWQLFCPCSSPGLAGTANNWLSINGRFRSHSGGGSGCASESVRNRTPVYSSTGVPSVSTIAQPLKQPAASRLFAVGTIA